MVYDIVTLVADGRLWRSEGGQRCLAVEKAILGFVAERRDGYCGTGKLVLSGLV